MDADEVRRLILALPEVEEYEHGGLPAFRVRGKRFASMLDHDSVNLGLSEQGIRSAVAEWPRWCHEGWFGKRLAAVSVHFGSIDRTVLEELLTEAWSRKAPKTIVRAHIGGSRPAEQRGDAT